MLLLLFYGAGEGGEVIVTPTVFLHGLITASKAVVSIDSYNTTGVIFIAPSDKGKVSGTS